MQKLVDDAASHGFNRRFLFHRDLAQLATYTVNLRLPDRLTVFLQRKNRGHHLQRLHARGKSVHFGLDYHLRPRRFFLTFRAVVAGHGLQIIHVIDEKSIQLVDLWRYVTRYGNVDEEHGAITASAQQSFTVFFTEDRLSGTSRGQDNVSLVSRVIYTLVRDGFTAENLGQVHRTFIRTVAHHDLLCSVGDQVTRRQLSHLACADQVNRFALECAEDPLGQLHCHRCNRY